MILRLLGGALGALLAAAGLAALVILRSWRRDARDYDWERRAEWARG